MLERKRKSILSLKLNKLANRVENLKTILILQNEMFLLMLFCKRILKAYDLQFSGETVYLKTF